MLHGPTNALLALWVTSPARQRCNERPHRRAPSPTGGHGETPMEVYLLWHIHKSPGGEENVILIGVYSTQRQAEQAQQRATQKPGFCDAPTDFCIDCYVIDQDHWTDGYVTVTHEDTVRRCQVN